MSCTSFHIADQELQFDCGGGDSTLAQVQKADTWERSSPENHLTSGKPVCQQIHPSDRGVGWISEG